jgi:uncharacterized membrane protein (UPF0136 family)
MSRTTIVAGVALAAIFALALTFPWRETFPRDEPGTDAAVFASLVIAATTAALLGAASRRPLPVAAAFTVGAVALYILGSSIDAWLGLRGARWPSANRDTDYLLGTNWLEAFWAIAVSATIAAPVGALLGAFGWAVASVSRHLRRTLVGPRD